MRRSPLAAVLLAACATVPPPPPDEPALPSDPQVVLLAPGAEPRALLRYRMQPGHSTLGMDMEMDMAMMEQKIDTPPIRVAMDIDDREVAPNGTSHVLLKVTRAEVVPRPGDDPGMLSRLNEAVGAVLGMTTDMKITARGFARDVKVTVPLGMKPEMQSMMQNMRTFTQQLAAAFPAEPVGVGARWKIATALDSGPLKVSQTIEVTLEKREPTAVTLAMAITQNAPPQPMKSPGLPPGASVTLDSYTGTGQGHLHTPLDRRTALTLEINVDTRTASTVVVNETRRAMTMSVGIKMRGVSPAP
jgi:hypothetical protein